MATSATSFTGSSLFAAQLQQSLSNAVQVASLPIQILNNDESALNSQSSALTSLTTAVTTLQNDVSSISSAVSGSSLQSTVSDPSVLTATTSSSTLPGTYTIQVLNAGSLGSAVSTSGLQNVSDPTTQSISAGTTFTLTVNGVTYTLEPPAQNLESLADSINASGAGVEATIINVGSPSSPDYQLALQATSIGNFSAQLKDGTQNLLQSVAGGSNASYTVNGEPPNGISSDSQTVTVAPGLSLNLESAGTATVQVSQSDSAISNAISQFVTDYNSVSAQLNAQRGQNAGPLEGNGAILTIAGALNSIVNYSSSSTPGVTSIEDIGLSFDQTGTLQFDPSVLAAMTPSQISQLTAFLGSPTTGGFLQTASNALDSLTAASTGTLTQESSSITSEITSTNSQITTLQDQVNLLQTNLTAQTSAADALISSLEQQNNYITGLFAQTQAIELANAKG